MGNSGRLAGLLQLLMLVTPFVAWAQTPAQFVIELPVIMDAATVGSLAVGVSGSEADFVEVGSWRGFGTGKLVPSLVDAIAARAEDGRIPVAAFAEAGLPLRYEPATLSIVLEPLEDQREAIVLHLGAGRTGTAVGAARAARVAGYVNLRAAEGFTLEDDGGDEGREGFLLGLDGAVRILGGRGAAVEWSALFDEDGDDPWRRGEVRVVHDDVERAIRYSALDIFYDAAGLQGAPPLFGLSAERRYDRLQPFRVVTATGQQSFALVRPSRVEIYVNGIFQEAVRLRPGRYELSDFTFVDGLNDVRIVVEDDSGERRTIDLTLSLSADLLAPGLSEFSANLGFRRDDDDDDITYDAGEPATSSFLRYGLTDELTVGANHQGDGSMQNAGVESVLGTALGTVGGALNGSASRQHGAGVATAIDWTYNFALFGPGRAQELDIDAIYTSPRYRRLGADPDAAPFTIETRARLTTLLPRQAAAAVFANYGQGRSGRDDELRLGLSLSKRIARTSLGARGEYIDADGGEYRAFLTLSVPLGADQSVVATWENDDDRSRVDWVKFSDDVVGDVSGRLGLVGSRDDLAVDGDVTYRGNRFVARASHEVGQSEFLGGDRRQNTTVGLESGIAYADGVVAVGRPVSDAFALVQRHPSLAETRILIGPSDRGVQAVADDFGPALVGNLDSYRLQTVDWQAEAPPIGYDLGDAEREVVPALHAGFLFEAGSAASRTVLGVAVDRAGRPLVLVPGRILRPDDATFAPRSTFTNRKGRFAAQGLDTGAYRVEFATEPPSAVAFEIAEDAATLVELGTVTVRPE